MKIIVDLLVTFAYPLINRLTSSILNTKEKKMFAAITTTAVKANAIKNSQGGLLS